MIEGVGSERAGDAGSIVVVGKFLWGVTVSVSWAGDACQVTERAATSRSGPVTSSRLPKGAASKQLQTHDSQSDVL